MKENQASSTAFTALQSTLYAAQNTRYNHLVSKDFEDAATKILSTSVEGKKRLKQLESPLFHIMNWTLERFFMPNIRLHIMLRKRFIEDTTLEAIQQGVTQVINLGAGFDTLIWRLHKKYPNVNFIEVDHPATSALKAEALLNYQDESPNLKFAAVDFSRQNINNVLERLNCFYSNRKTLFICEGVLMYLEEEDVIQLMESIKKLSNDKNILVLSCVEPMASPKNDTNSFLSFYLKFKGEPLNWCIERKNLAFFLETQAYRLTEIADADVFNRRYLDSQTKDKLHQSEYIAVAQIN